MQQNVCRRSCLPPSPTSPTSPPPPALQLVALNGTEGAGGGGGGGDGLLGGGGGTHIRDNPHSCWGGRSGGRLQSGDTPDHGPWSEEMTKKKEKSEKTHSGGI